ncbi:glycoside hydrolase family 16 protein, partial [Micrococcus sp. SIMBA_131]
SAKLTTQNKGDWTYGRYEIKAKLPKGQGMWPAIWMMPTDYELYSGWPATGEIDIMELLGHDPDTVYGTLHYGKPWKNTGESYDLP